MSYVRLVLGWLLGAVTIIVFLVGESRATTSTYTNISVFALSTFLTFYCACVILAEIRNKRAVSPIALVAALVLIHFAIPAFLMVSDVLRFVSSENQPYLFNSLLFVLCCFAMFQLGVVSYRLIAKKKAKRDIKSVGRDWLNSQLIILVTGLLIVGWVVRFYIIISGWFFQIQRTIETGVFQAAFAILEMFPIYAFVLLMISYYQRQLRKPSLIFLKYFIAVIGIGEAIYWLGAGRKFELLLVPVVAVVVRYIFLRRLPGMSIILTGMLATIALFPAMFYYRLAVELGHGDDMKVTHVPAILGSAIGNSSSDYSAIQIVGGRLNLNESLAASIRIVDQKYIEPKLGADYWNVVIGVVPRFLWPNKPKFHYGTEFGWASGIIDQTDERTSISVTYFGEAYQNFVWFGCLIFVFFGLLVEAVYYKAVSSKKVFPILLYMLVLGPLVYIGGTVALYIGGLIKTVILFWIIDISCRVTRTRSNGAGMTRKSRSRVSSQLIAGQP